MRTAPDGFGSVFAVLVHAVEGIGRVVLALEARISRHNFVPHISKIVSLRARPMRNVRHRNIGSVGADERSDPFNFDGKSVTVGIKVEVHSICGRAIRDSDQHAALEAPECRVFDEEWFDRVDDGNCSISDGSAGQLTVVDRRQTDVGDLYIVQRAGVGVLELQAGASIG